MLVTSVHLCVTFTHVCDNGLHGTFSRELPWVGLIMTQLVIIGSKVFWGLNVCRSSSSYACVLNTISELHTSVCPKPDSPPHNSNASNQAEDIQLWVLRAGDWVTPHSAMASWITKYRPPETVYNNSLSIKKEANWVITSYCTLTLLRTQYLCFN